VKILPTVPPSTEKRQNNTSLNFFIGYSLLFLNFATFYQSLYLSSFRYHSTTLSVSLKMTVGNLVPMTAHRFVQTSKCSPQF